MVDKTGQLSQTAPCPLGRGWTRHPGRWAAPADAEPSRHAGRRIATPCPASAIGHGPSASRCLPLAGGASLACTRATRGCAPAAAPGCVSRDAERWFVLFAGDWLRPSANAAEYTRLG